MWSDEWGLMSHHSWCYCVCGGAAVWGHHFHSVFTKDIVFPSSRIDPITGLRSVHQARLETHCELLYSRHFFWLTTTSPSRYRPLSPLSVELQRTKEDRERKRDSVSPGFVYYWLCVIWFQPRLNWPARKSGSVCQKKLCWKLQSRISNLLCILCTVHYGACLMYHGAILVTIFCDTIFISEAFSPTERHTWLHDSVCFVCVTRTSELTN